MARAWVQAVRKRVNVETSVEYSRYTLDDGGDGIVLPEEEAPEEPVKTTVKTTEETKFFNVVLSLSVEEAAYLSGAIVAEALAGESRYPGIQHALTTALNRARAAQEDAAKLALIPRSAAGSPSPRR